MTATNSTSRKKDRELQPAGVRNSRPPRYIWGVSDFDGPRAFASNESRGPMPPTEVRGDCRRGLRGFTPIELLAVIENVRSCEGSGRAVGSYPVRGKGTGGGLAKTKTFDL